MTHTSGTLAWNVGSSSVKGVLFSGKKIILRWQADLERQRLLVLSPRTTIRVRSMEELVAAVHRLCPSNVPITRHVHRIVYGGPTQWKPARVNAAVLHTLRRYQDRDPLHLPAALTLYRLVQQSWPSATGWFVFDSGIYQHLPSVVREYALPRWVVEKYHIRRLGFHGISHWWAAMHSAAQAGVPLRSWSGITVHLGSGSSITAWRHGLPIDTSMGFSPLSGPMMATRTGDLDPLVPMFLVRHAGMTPLRVEKMMNEESGFQGITGSADLRDALSAVGHHQPGWPSPKRVKKESARLAIDMFTYEVAKYIGAYRALLPTTSSIVFTGAIGENRQIQQRIVRWLHATNRLPIRVVHADEERAMVGLLDGVIY